MAKVLASDVTIGVTFFVAVVARADNADRTEATASHAMGAAMDAAT